VVNRKETESSAVKERRTRRLRIARSETGLSQEQVADVLDVDSHTVSGWETGRIRPPGIALYALSQFYGKSAAWLAGEDTLAETPSSGGISETASTYTTDDEQELIRHYRGIPKGQRRLVVRIVAAAAQQDSDQV